MLLHEEEAGGQEVRPENKQIERRSFLWSSIHAEALPVSGGEVPRATKMPWRSWRIYKCPGQASRVGTCSFKMPLLVMAFPKRHLNFRHLR